MHIAFSELGCAQGAHTEGHKRTFSASSITQHWVCNRGRQSLSPFVGCPAGLGWDMWYTTTYCMSISVFISVPSCLWYTDSAFEVMATRDSKVEWFPPKAKGKAYHGYTWLHNTKVFRGTCVCNSELPYNGHPSFYNGFQSWVVST